MINYRMSPTGRQFHESDAGIKMICGPYGSGKSTICAVDILSYACAQKPAPDGVRYTRVGVVRATYPELTNMTRKSLMEVLPAECGRITESAVSPRGLYIIPLADGTTVNLELQLFALLDERDCHKILSANWTFAWINEATGVTTDVLTAVMKRIGRYPSQDMGGVSWGGVMMDYNMPVPGSWLAEYMRNPEPNWEVIMQPPAAFKHEDESGRVTFTVNPDAENLRNLGAKEPGDPDTFASQEEYDEYLQSKGMRYYRNQITKLLKDGRKDLVENQYCMLDTPVVDGKPVYPNFSTARHVSVDPIEPEPFHDIIVGMDQSGVHPAAVIVQQQRGKWCILDEMYAEGEGLETFLYGILLPRLRERYSTNPVTAVLDPSNTRDSWQGITPKSRLEEIGVPAVTEITNSPKIRIQTVEHMLNLDTGGILIDPACELLIRGFQVDYRYRRIRAGGSTGAAYTPTPEKNEASHLHDALQYVALWIFRNDSTDHTRETEFAKSQSDRRRVLRSVV